MVALGRRGAGSSTATGVQPTKQSDLLAHLASDECRNSPSNVRALLLHYVQAKREKNKSLVAVSEKLDRLERVLVVQPQKYPDYSFSLSSIRKRLRLPTTDPSLPSLRPNIPASSIIGYPRAPLRSQTQHFSSSNASTSSSSSSPPPVLRRRSTFNTLPRGVMRPAPSLDELLDLPPSYGARNPRVVAAAADVDPDLNWEFEELLRRSVAPGESGRGTRGEAGRPGYQPSVSSSLPGYEDVDDGTTSVRSLAVG